MKKPFAYLLVNVIDVKTFYVFILVTFNVVHVLLFFERFIPRDAMHPRY